jgi:hypothetical protein
MWHAKHGPQLSLPGNAAGELIGLPPPHIAQPTPSATWRPARPRPLQCRGPGLSRLQCCARSPPLPARIGPVEFGGMVAARCPRAALSWNLLGGIEAPASRGAVVMGRRHLSRNADCDAIRYASTLSRSVFRYRHGDARSRPPPALALVPITHFLRDQTRGKKTPGRPRSAASSRCAVRADARAPAPDAMARPV